MRRRAPVAVTVALAVATVPATVATAQSPVVGTEQRLPDPAWTGAPALAPTPLTTPAALLDLVAGSTTRGFDATSQTLLRTGFVGGVVQVTPAAGGRPALTGWATQFATAGGAGSGAVLVSRMLRSAPDRISTTIEDIAAPAGARRVTVTTGATTRTLVTFTAGTWLYGLLETRTTEPPRDLDALAAQLWERQPDRPDPAGAQAAPVNDALKTALAEAHARVRGVFRTPIPGSTQAATYAGSSWALTRFPGAALEPVLFRTVGTTWFELGDTGGQGCPRIPAAVREVWGLTRTCPLSPSPVIDPTATDAAGGDSPFHGIGTWVWEVDGSGGVTAIVEKATANGISTVYVKSGDGTRYWRQFDRSLAPLKAAGLRVCAWQYVYGRRPIREARVGARAIRAGADCFVVDAEGEFEGGRGSYEGRTYRAARRYMRELRRRSPRDVSVGLTSFAYVDLHSSFPYSAFLDGSDGADLLMPQVYWGAFRSRVQTAMRRTARWNSIYDVPIAPIAGTYQREPRSELAEFRCLSGALGWPGVSYWSFQHTNAGQWPVLGRPLTNCSIPAQARTYPTLRIRSRGDAVVRIQARLRAWGVPIPRTGFFLRRTRSGVRAFQRSRGLEADGVVGPLTWAALLEEPPISG